MYYFRNYFLIPLGILLLAIRLGPVYGEGPDPKDHPFDPDLPTEFKGEMVTLMTPKALTFMAYEVRPEEFTGKSILLIHEWWGLNAHMKKAADQFADFGYRVLAIDLYNGQSTGDRDRAGQLMKQVDMTKARQKLTSAIEYLTIDSNKVAVMGWCFGGGLALKASLDNPELISATVIYYGELETDPDVLKKLKTPVLGIFAKKDQWITPNWVEAFGTALEKAGVAHEIFSYDADHAFANPSSPRYDEIAYIDALDKTLTFLKKNLSEE